MPALLDSTPLQTAEWSCKSRGSVVSCCVKPSKESSTFHQHICMGDGMIIYKGAPSVLPQSPIRRSEEDSLVLSELAVEGMVDATLVFL